MSDLLRYGVVGAGYFGAELARAAAELPGAKLAAVQSASGTGARRVAEELGCDAFTSLDALVRSVDVVVVASPNDVHREAVQRAAELGRPVFCEKPLALSTVDAESMISTCQNAGVVLMAGHVQRFYDGARRMKTLLDGGVIGRPLVAHVERTGWEPPRQKVSWKKMQAHSGGHLFHHIHEIDLVHWLMGPAAHVYAAGGNLAHHGAGHGDEDDVLLLTIGLRSGSFATMEYGSAFRLGKHFLRVNGTDGALVLDSQTASLEIHTAEGVAVEPFFTDPESQADLLALFRRTDGGVAYGLSDERPPHYLRAAARAELALLDSVVRGVQIPAGSEDLFDGSAALTAVRTAQGALESLRTGRIVDL